MKTEEQIRKMVETMRENSKLVIREQSKMVLIEKMGVLEWVLKDEKDTNSKQICTEGGKKDEM